MPFLRVFPVLGVIVMVFALTMLVPLGVSLWTQDGASSAFPGAMALTFVCGALMRSAVWRVGHKLELQKRDGILLVGLAWTLLPLFACVPLLLYFGPTSTPLSFTDAYFEAISGLTTTGATVLVGLDRLPGSINLWRCFLQWLGGMGILVLAVAILPMLGVGGSQLFRAEATGPMKDAKLTPRITETAKGLWTVYCLLSLACVLGYWLAGMSVLDAWIHMFSTLSLGGLSSHDSSFGHFQSPAAEWVAIVFMLLASCNFALYFVTLVKRQPGRIWRDAEWRGSMLLLVGSGLFVAGLLLAKGAMSDPGEALRTALFNVVSIGSTTGYSTVDYTTWPVFAPIFMIMLSGVATSAGSTGAGIKMARIVILLKQARREMARIVHPRAVNPVTMGGNVVDSGTIFSVLGFMLVYGGTIIGLTMVLLLTDMPFDTAFSAVVASVNNMGPGLNEVGPAGNFAGLSDFQTWVCALAMLLGRLEMLSFLVLFTPGFWRK
ncbi:MAG: potassium transporter Trk [Burkholderiales bacterium RIFCSPLOWO2_12_67_14]|nr:MAG: potassium transporter Trk [Burkholderiales bacterium RIFCSPLOWO2_02_FULL_67_64]OGB40602.1 MAG: potassium transporter Trk [Burkholderiales bacterium RIFCSPHIGHO2_12_FULL_67_38]OGB43426.1 MAG: potassium transporter Trk [Burkholderiales bacterium RIFCSPLOWO2_12_67_14]